MLCHLSVNFIQLHGAAFGNASIDGVTDGVGFRCVGEVDMGFFVLKDAVYKVTNLTVERVM